MTRGTVHRVIFGSLNLVEKSAFLIQLRKGFGKTDWGIAWPHIEGTPRTSSVRVFPKTAQELALAGVTGHKVDAVLTSAHQVTGPSADQSAEPLAEPVQAWDDGLPVPIFSVQVDDGMRKFSIFASAVKYGAGNAFRTA